MAVRLHSALWFVLLSILAPVPGQAESSWESLQFITEEFPPYNYTEGGVARGIAVDLLIESAEAAGLALQRKDIRSYPWARGYQMAQKGPGIALFAMTRSAEREHLFKWVGPVISTRVVLLARKDRQLKINQPAALAAYQIGAIRDDIGHQLLKTLGIGANNIQLFSSAVPVANMLDKGRIDFWAYDETTARWFIKMLQLDNSRFEAAYLLKEGNMYYAFSPDVD
ncbi:MAG: substrate-binding periplasmic protein, partial [Gammaproteobacteria bacterium]